MGRWVKRVVFVALGLAVFAAIGIAYYLHRYPYGWSHCCDKQLELALIAYAERHGGWFPRGEATPEASLSLLNREDPDLVNAYLLRGKSVPLAVVNKRLASGQLLTPETCGWQYVEGLRQDDDARLALFWDKAGLGHNGERLPAGGHHVCFVNGNIEYISGEEWVDFLAVQERMRAAIARPR